MARHSHSPKAPLKLGHLYALDFAEDKTYSDNWHRAGADVHMTRLLLNAYFNKLEEHKDKERKELEDKLNMSESDDHDGFSDLDLSDVVEKD
ncbi:uncharacterized protein N7529_002461 [Penicillium soppii]|uniref:uncharacterized protein n=1 Tax=Penicillium soppii TaxID=69789 RepID=UPI0025491205|nr:uncharacterized protein N7529_002461 [Penicillium soppii]KAJ5874031.1 hypothetical protein N7529_002461 [Penicillium soppii]